MNLIQFLAMNVHQGPVFIDGIVNSVVVVFQNEFREGGPKSLILQDLL